MRDSFRAFVLEATGATDMQLAASIQTLWSGYGEILRAELEGAAVDTVILKHIVLPQKAQHPRGWNTSNSHQRKRRSYQVEEAWYQVWSQRCDDACRVPRCYGATSFGPNDHEQLLLLEDLDAAGFPARKSGLALAEVKRCLRWLAHFHATFIHQTPEKLWPIGTYWHLATRPDELEAMAAGPLKDAAAALDKRLNECHYKTFVHGDAKVANFCFSEDGTKVAAVDFQYVGGGCGMKDVVYLLGSCLREDECADFESELLDDYFVSLRAAIASKETSASVESVDFDALEAEWRALFPIAWTDFYRFLQGWMPTHPKINPYSQRLAVEVLSEWEET